MKTTREGKRFVIATFLIAVAAVNTGNNLIYLILSLLLSFVLLSVVLLKINLRALSLEVSACRPIFACEETSLDLGVLNNKKFISAYSINIIESGSGSVVHYQKIPPRLKDRREMKVIFRKRGVYRYGNFFVRSGFPFILMTAQTPLAVSGEVIVYPALLDLEGILPEGAGHESGEAIRTIGSGDDIYSIRKFRYGDDWRKIHWKASAKASSLLVREYAEYEFRKTTIVLDNLVPGTDGSHPGEEHEGLFEKAVSLAGSLAKYFLDEGHFVRIFSAGKVIPFGRGDEQLFRILDIFAVIQPESSWKSSVPGDVEGLLISVMMSPGSPSLNYAGAGSMVIYADSL